MEELKLIVELLGQVSSQALYGVIASMVLNFFKVPVVIVTVGYVVNSVLKHIKVVKQ